MKFFEDIFGFRFIPTPNLVSIGNFSLHWYGFFIGFGVFLILTLSIRDWKKRGKKEDDIYDGVLIILPFAVLGARIYHVFTALDFYFPNGEISFQNILNALNIANGGLGIFGAVLGGAFGLVIFSKIKKVSALEIANLIFPFIPLAQAVGRWGNFFNQELFGTPTDLPWGIYIEPQNRPFKFYNEKFFHPLFLYESLFCFFLFLVLFKFREKFREKNFVIPLYLIGYGIWRFFAEFIRATETPTYFGIRLEQWVSLFQVLISIIWVFVVQKNMKTEKKKVEKRK